MARLLVASDLHYPGGDLAWRLAQALRRVEVDALVLAGDFLGVGSERYADKLFSLLRRFYGGPILAVWGKPEVPPKADPQEEGPIPIRPTLYLIHHDKAQAKQPHQATNNRGAYAGPG